MFAGSLINRNIWTPKRISPSLWLDAADSSTVTLVSGVVSEWRDKSGYNNHLIQNVVNESPTYQIGEYLGFDGDRDHLTFQYGFFYNWNSFSIYFVLSAPLQSNDAIIGPRDYYSVGLELVCTNIIWQPTLVRANGVSMITDNLWSTDSTTHITSLRCDSISTVGRRSGSTIALTSGITPLSFNGVYALGAYAFGHQSKYYNAQFSIRELIVKNNKVSDAENNKIEGYLAHKWGLDANLPANHPYKNYPPRGL